MDVRSRQRWTSRRLLHVLLLKENMALRFALGGLHCLGLFAHTMARVGYEWEYKGFVKCKANDKAIISDHCFVYFGGIVHQSLPTMFEAIEGLPDQRH